MRALSLIAKSCPQHPKQGAFYGTFQKRFIPTSASSSATGASQNSSHLAFRTGLTQIILQQLRDEKQPGFEVGRIQYRLAIQGIG